MDERFYENVHQANNYSRIVAYRAGIWCGPGFTSDMEGPEQSILLVFFKLLDNKYNLNYFLIIRHLL